MQPNGEAPRHVLTRTPIGSATAAIATCMILAATATPASAQSTSQHSDYHDKIPNEIVVTALIPRTQKDVLAGISVISGEQLTRDLRGTIGDTLARQPGVSSTSFGPNASRPILRGLQGERVRVLTDGIGAFDVSNTSVDHAVAINPMTAERVEVVRGPAALLYGSSAIGGVVNVIDARIPHRVPDEPIHVEGLATYGSASDERTLSGKAESPLGGGFVAHVDGTWSKTGDMRTGGYILSPALRAQAIASGDPAIEALANLKGKLPNSAAESWDVAGALAYIGSGGDIGISVNHLDNLYGVPVRYAVVPGTSAETVHIHMKQDRADMRAELHVNGAFIDRIRLRAGFANYRHSEIDQNGVTGTQFFSKGMEGRGELVQSRRGGWDGVSGVQFLARDMHIVGDEKFLPANSTTQVGLFTLQSLELGKLRIEGGARFEHSRVTAAADANLGYIATARSFDSFSYSAGLSYDVLPDWRLGVNVVRSERAPSAEELFARGPHAGTQAFELGNPNFGKEKSWGLEGSLRGQGKGYHASLSGFYNRFNGFIYDSPVADSICQAAIAPTQSLDFPCFQYNQARARTWGFEAQADVTATQWSNWDLVLDAETDYVRETIDGFGPGPRIPPFRIMGGA